MRILSVLALVGCVLAAGFTSPVYAVKKTPQAAPAPMRVQVDIAKDGSAIRSFSRKSMIRNTHDLRHFQTSRFPYAPARMKILEIKASRRRNGKTRIIAAGQIADKKMPARPGRPSTEMRMKVVSFKDLQVGDEIAITVRAKMKPQLPGIYMFQSVFSPFYGRQAVQLRFSAPAAMPLYISAPRLKVLPQTQKNGRRFYGVDYLPEELPHKGQKTDQPMMLANREWAPRIFVSSLADYPALGAVLAKSFAASARPNATLRAKAAEICKGKADKAAKARALYGWLVVHIRYQRQNMTLGPLTVRPAADVLKAGSGSAYDLAGLYIALLRAAGLGGEFALFDPAEAAPSLPKVPDISALSAAMVWLPDLQRFVSLTDKKLPFGVLPAGGYDKPVLVFGGKAARLARTPVLKPAQNRSKLDADVSLLADGNLKAQVTVRGVGLAALPLQTRLAAPVPRPNGFYVAKYDPLPGGKESGLKLTYKSLKPVVGERHKGVALSAYMLAAPARLMIPGSEAMVGDIGRMLPPRVLKIYGAPARPCRSAVDDQRYTLHLPKNFRLKALPKDENITGGGVSYRSHWAQKGNSISVERHFRVHFAHGICRGKTASDALAALTKIRQGLLTKLDLAAVK